MFTSKLEMAHRMRVRAHVQTHAKQSQEIWFLRLCATATICAATCIQHTHTHNTSLKCNITHARWVINLSGWTGALVRVSVRVCIGHQQEVRCAAQYLTTISLSIECKLAALHACSCTVTDNREEVINAEHVSLSMQRSLSFD